MEKLLWKSCYGKADGVGTTPTALVHDREGPIWANTATGIIRFNGARWEHIGHLALWAYNRILVQLQSGKLDVERERKEE
jgi:hypothetical protein